MTTEPNKAEQIEDLSRKLETATALLERYREMHAPSMGDSLDAEEELDEQARAFLATLTDKEPTG